AVFAGGMYVFPGGRVDHNDGEGDNGFLVAAIRECYEEAGVLLAEEGEGQLVRDGHIALSQREAVHDGTLDIHTLCARHQLRLATERMAWVAWWVTPKGESPRRFDTRFFLAVAPEDQKLVHDHSETIASRWLRPAEAIDCGRRGEMMLMPPTIANLEFLSQFDSADAALVAGRQIGTPPRIQPHIRFGDDGKMIAIVMPGEAGYDALD
ncbi:MAG: hypothetical protein ABIQ39_16075, partial [Ilumatobacteraceae bacterium]